jgi:hypothetical protein
MTPLFLECPESLFSCNSFQAVLTALLSADKTYTKIAKDLIGSDGRGPVLTFFGNMLQAQLLNYQKFGLQSPVQLIGLWIQSFTRLPNWNKDVGVIYLLDLIARVSYQFPDCWFMFKEHFRYYFTVSFIFIKIVTFLIEFFPPETPRSQSPKVLGTAQSHIRIVGKRYRFNAQ